MSIIIGTDGNNTIAGTSGGDIIAGRGGNDLINAGAGNDIVCAGSGNDTVNGGAGNDLIDGGSGNDTLNGGSGNDIILGGAGNDTVTGGVGLDIISGGSGNDTLDGGAGTDIVSGDAGNDTLLYRVSENVAALDLYDGGSGNDTLRIFATQLQANASGFQADIARLQDLISQNGSATTCLASLGLQVVSIERVEVVIIPGGGNSGPTAVNDNVTATEDTPLTITAASLLANDADPDAGDTRALVSVQGAQNGSVALDQAGNIVFTPAANFSGAASFTYTMRDAAGATSTATVFISVGAVADTPTLTASNAAGSEDSPIALQISSALTDSSEVLSVSITGVPAGATLNHGTLSGGVWTVAPADLADLAITPPHDFSGAINLTVTATSTDGSSTAQSQTSLAVTVDGVADAPVVAAADSTIEVVASADDIPLGLSIALADASETLGAVEISGVPSSYVLSVGVEISEGVWLVAPGDLETVALRPANGLTGEPGTLDLTIVGTSTDGASSASTTIHLSVDIAEAANVLNSRAVDGYISGATVFSDSNGNGLLDPGEAFAVTRADGTFSLVGADPLAQLVTIGGVDVSTGMLFEGVLRAPAGSTVVTPITTLVAALIEGGSAATIEEANAAISAAFGLAPGTDFTSFDPVPAAASGNVEATEILAAAIQIQTTITQISAAAGGASAVDSVVTAIAASIDAGGAVDLTESTTLAAIVTEVVPGGDQAAIDAVSAVVAAANTAIEEAATGGGDALTVLTEIAQAASVALGQTTDDLATAGLDATLLQDVVADNTGDALNSAIQAAPVGDADGAQVGDIGNDTLTGAGGSDVIEGRDGNDTLSGLGGNDTLRGENGSDRLVGGAGNDLLDGGAGQDRAIYTDATGAIDVQLAAGTVTGDGSVGTDTLRSVEQVIGSSFNDTFNAAGFWTGFGAPTGDNIGSVGNSGTTNNVFEGGAGDDTIIGNGRTTISYRGATSGVTVNVGTGLATGDASVGTDQFSNASFVAGSSFADTMIGSNSTTQSDFLVGGAGDDFLDGQGGFDFASYSFTVNDTTTGGVVINMAAGIVTGDASTGTDTLRSIESVRGSVFADSFNATGFGLAGAANVGNNGTFNEFEGLAGNDTVVGNNNTRILFNNASGAVTVDLRDGYATGDSSVGTDSISGISQVRGTSFNDTLRGSDTTAFSETFDGWLGDDFIDGRGGFDAAVYNSSMPVSGGITVDMAAGSVTGGAGNDTLRSIEQVTGTNLNDTYNATGFGLAGALNVGNNGTFNSFQGAGGNDTITGNGNTQVAYFSALAGVTVSLATGAAFSTQAADAANIGVDTMTGGVNNVQGSNFDDSITGSTGNETLGGGAGNDAINGGDGNDVITGGAGNDTIDGGNGTDVAVFAGLRASYTVNFNTPGAGQTQIAGGADATDTLSGVELLQFGSGAGAAYYLIASSSSGSPVNLNGMGFSGSAPLTTLTGNADDFLTIGGTLNGRTIDLGAGTGDTINLGVAGAGYNLSLIGVETLNGAGGNEFVSLINNATGMTIDLGAGTDTLALANGANSISVTGVDQINGTDFSGSSDDALTLLNTVSGVSVNLANGTNTLDLAEGTNSLATVYNVRTINGSAGNDTLTMTGDVFDPGGATTIDLGDGVDTLNLADPDSGMNLIVANAETVNGTAFGDMIQLSTGSTITGGAGADIITVSNGTDNIRYTSAAESSGFTQDQISGFDAANDAFVFSGVSGFTGALTYVGTNAFSGSPSTRHSEARLFGSTLQIDVDGDGQMTGNDIEIQLVNPVGTLTNANFVVEGIAAPTDIALSGTMVAEDSAIGSVVGVLSATDPDANDTATFSLVDDAGGLFAINGTSLTVAGPLDYEGATSHSVTVRVTDLIGNTYDETFTIGVTNINEGPTSISLSNSIVVEDSVNGMVVGALSSSDPDAGDTSSYTLTDSAGGRFAVSGSNLVVNGSLDYEANSSHGVTVRVTDSGGLTYDQTFTINVGNVNEAPTSVALSNATVAENSAANTVVGTLSFIDPDAGDTVTYSLENDAGGRFAISGGDLVTTGLLDYEAGSSYNVTVRLTDAGGLTRDEVFAIEVTNVNEQPTDIALSSTSVDENSLNGTVVGTLSATDPDANDTATYTLLSDAGGRFAIKGANLEVAGSLDYETNTSHQVTVRVTDAGGLIHDETFTINVNNLGEGEIPGDEDPNTLNGTAGSDTIRGFGGNDFMTGFAGDDLLDGGAHFDTSNYSTATGAIDVQLASGVVTGDASVGTDTLRSVEIVRGTDFVDTFNAAGFWTGIGAQTGLNIGSFSNAGVINNTFEGQGGNDIITGNGRTNLSYLNATAGVTIDVNLGTAVGNSSVGTDQFTSATFFRGSEFDDVMRGGSSTTVSDAFTGGMGDDFIDGRAGFDFATYSGNFDTNTGGIVINMTTGVVTDAVLGNTSNGTDTLRSIESVRGTNFADTYNATGFGAIGLDPLTNNVGSNGTFNEFEGAGGDDTVTGNGNTRIIFTLASGGVTVDLQTGDVNGDASVGHDTITGGVSQVRGSNFNDSISGSAGNNIFDGRWGNDFLDGRDGFDQVLYTDNLITAGVTVNMAAGTVVGDATVGSDTLRSIEQVIGSAFNDTYDATGFGGVGALNVGNSGAFNSFQGGAGNDTIIGNGNTQILYGNATGGVTVNLATGVASGAGAGTDSITVGTVNNVQGSNNNDTLTGSNNNEVFGGAGGIDTINGGGGSDAITGGGGNDSIDGGTGGDMAVYTGAIGEYTVLAGSVQDNTGGRDGTDTLSNVEMLQFGSGVGAAYYLIAGGSSGAPVDISGLGLSGIIGLSSLTGTTDDFLTIGQNFFGRPIDLGAGTGDTVNLGISGVGYTLALSNVEVLNGTGGNEFVSLTNSAAGLTIDLGAGSDTLALANGANTVSVTGAEQINGTDFSGSSNDTLTLLNTVSGVSVNLANGTNTLNLASGANSFADIFNVQAVNGTADADTLSLGNIFPAALIDLGDGVDTVIASGSTMSFALANVENIAGGNGDNYVGLDGVVNGLSVDLSGGSDTLRLQNGSNTLSVANVEQIHANDFDGSGNPAFDDTLTLSNGVSGLSVNLFNGINTLNLAAGANQLVDIYSVRTINGSGANDDLTVSGAIYDNNNLVTLDLGAGTDTLNLTSANGTFNLVIANAETITASSGMDFIQLATGSTITGGLSQDFLTASTGADMFRFVSVADSTGPTRDHVTDFDASLDTFVFQGIGGFTPSFDFVGTDAFSGTAGDPQSQARMAGNTLQIDVDGDGQMTTNDMEIELNALVGALTNANFEIL